MTRMYVHDIAAPEIHADDASAPFFDAAAEGVLLIRRCPGCGAYAAPTAETCEVCMEPASEWAPASGAATLVTWAVVHSPPHPAFTRQLPLVSAVVELAEGPWLPMRLVTGPGEALPELAAGLPLEIVFARPAVGAAYPLCTVATAVPEDARA
jgi:uncharacterized protein